MYNVTIMGLFIIMKVLFKYTCPILPCAPHFLLRTPYKSSFQMVTALHSIEMGGSNSFSSKNGDWTRKNEIYTTLIQGPRCLWQVPQPSHSYLPRAQSKYAPCDCHAGGEGFKSGLGRACCWFQTFLFSKLKS